MGLALEGHGAALAMDEGHVAPDLQGFCQVPPAVKLVLAYSPQCSGKKMYSGFHLF